MSDTGWDLQRAYDEGYKDGKRDAADAIEALQAEVEKWTFNATLEQSKAIANFESYCKLNVQLPKRGQWELVDGAEPMRWGCSRCKYLSWKTSSYCPRCGAKMEVQDGDI